MRDIEKGIFMARQTIVRLRDDIDGGEAAETVQFTWAGTAYEIDLNKKNADAFAEAIAPYVRAARRAPSAGRRGSTARKSARSSKPDVSAIRAWAAENGYSVSQRGRLPSEVVSAYNAAQGAGGVQSSTPARKSAAGAKKAPAKTARASTGRKRAATKAAPRKNAAKKSTRSSTAARKRAGARKSATGSTGAQRGSRR